MKKGNCIYVINYDNSYKEFAVITKYRVCSYSSGTYFVVFESPTGKVYRKFNERNVEMYDTYKEAAQALYERTKKASEHWRKELDGDYIIPSEVDRNDR